jgi:hypothetical protein
MDPRPPNALLIIAGAQDEADIRQKLAEARNDSFAVHAVASTWGNRSSHSFCFSTGKSPRLC